ncbi:MAG: 50S ribosome-binding GTPase, partial [Planctomycetaceae bacterium]|nr:50S ribosome-binding GTPase [Planctomycetaceae bacterium]
MSRQAQNSAECHVVRLTPPGRSAVASLMICGNRATDILKRCITLHVPASQNAEKSDGSSSERLFPLQSPLFGHFHLLPDANALQKNDLPEQFSPWEGCEEVVLFVRQPDSCELHCHGGDAAIAAIEKTLVALGCVRLDWNDWLQRLITNGESSLDVISLEALQQLALAETEFTAKLLLAQYHGGLSEKIKHWTQEQQRWQQKILNRETVVPDAGLSETISEIETLLDSYRFGKHLVSPFRVALVGPVNSGKSTLMNAIVGYQRAITSPVSGTTRDPVSAKTMIDGWPMMLTDTAGLRETDNPIEREGIRQAGRMIDEADLILHVL